MNILYITYFLNGALMIAVAIGLGIYLTRRFELDWRLWWIGAAIFILSQVGHLPFNAYIVIPFLNKLNSSSVLPAAGILAIGAIIIGLSAGLWEELARFAMFRWWAKDARSWGKGLLAGAGHGGAEAIILGVLLLYNFFNMVIIRKMDLATLVPADQLAAAHAQVSAYWSAPWYFTLLGAVERFLTIPLQICFAVIVLQTFVRRQWFWVWLAVLYHALADMTVVIANNLVSYYWTEVIIMIFSVISVVIIFALRQPEPPENIVAPAPVPTEFKLKPPEETMENLDKTRYR